MGCEPVSTNITLAESIEVTIERILPGGYGLAHADGRTLMVALAAPGDRLRVQIDRVKGGVSFAWIQEIITPSTDRVEPPCPYFGRCGGCDFQELNYEAQLATKIEIIKDCLRRIGKIEKIPQFQITPAPNQWHYRSRAQWQYDSIRRRLGYFEAGSRRVCDIADCAVLAPELRGALESLRARMQDSSLSEDARYFRAIAGDDGLSIADDRDRSPTVREGATNRGTSPTVRESTSNRGNSPTVKEGSRRFFQSKEVHEITRTIHGETYRLNAESFFQTNADLLPQLIDTALDQAQGETAVELYCGVGVFTLPLARRFAHVIGVESDTAAARFARNNLARAGLANARIVNKDVADWLEDLECAGTDGALDQPFGLRPLVFDLCPEGGDERPTPRTQTPKTKDPRPKIIGEPIQSGGVAAATLREADFLLLDPPRTGAESRVIAGVLKLNPGRICYVSCDPATLARDLKKLLAGGYALDSLVAFDMFPQTHHVETVVHLGSRNCA